MDRGRAPNGIGHLIILFHCAGTQDISLREDEWLG